MNYLSFTDRKGIIKMLKESTFSDKIFRENGMCNSKPLIYSESYLKLNY